jgi:hypothetical protein
MTIAARQAAPDTVKTKPVKPKHLGQLAQSKYPGAEFVHVLKRR